MPSNTQLLKQIDRVLYKRWIEKIDDCTEKAVRFNEGKHLRHLCFNSDQRFLAYPINSLAKAYLDECLVELAPVLNERAIVNAYFLRCMNQLSSSRSSYALFLLPSDVLAKHFYNLDPVLPEHIQLIINKFKELPEYITIKKRVFLEAMLND